MRENYERESTAALAVASLLLNLLVMLVISGSVWITYSLLSEPNTIGLLLRETAWR